MAANNCYGELQEGRFRLLHMADVDGTLSCTTEDVPFDNPPDYDAVSYSWGKVEMASSLRCNGHSLPATSCLLDTLYYLHRYRPTPHRPIWIDGVCINQQDDRERKVQVPRMGEIYSKAQRVLVWLGVSAEDSDLAMDKIAGLTERLVRIGRHVRPDDLPLYGLEAKSHPIWPALGHLFNRSWFQRLWIIQEATLAADVAVMCGSKSVHWSTITSFYNAIHKTALTHLVLGEYEVRQFRSDGLFGISLILRAKVIVSQWRGYQLLPILCEGRAKQCTEPVDRIWGFLGLLDSETRDQIVRSGWIDYSQEGKKNYWRAYVNIGKWILKHQDPTLNLLSLAPSNGKHSELPSWCPDWRCIQEHNAFVAISSYRAGFENTEPVRSHVTVTPESNVIKIPGFQNDTVETVATSLYTFSQNWDRVVGPEGKAAQLLEWEAECLKISQKTYSQEADEIPEAHWRTLIGNRVSLKLCEHDLSADYHNWKQDLRLKRENNEIGSWNANELSGMNTYSSAVSMACQGRKFFSTRKGRIGIGPTGLKSGDAVCILHSGGPLYILRFKIGDEVAELVGDAYVHGLMGGKGLSMENRAADRDFVIG